MKSAEKQSRPRGRPRSFDRDAALDQAMRLFWRHGYEATSVSALAEAMQINAPSLYAAFGDKQALFFETIRRYQNGTGSFAARALEESPTAEAAVRRTLMEAARELTNPAMPPGCMIVGSALNTSKESEPVAETLAAMRRAGEKAIAERLARAQREGELAKSVNVKALAAYVSTVLQGMTIKAKDGASRRELESIATQAMDAWPKTN
jgi:TetR/AcrR family transcriptional regulator, copper-responsive repressor